MKRKHPRTKRRKSTVGYEKGSDDMSPSCGPRDKKSWRPVIAADMFNPNLSYAKSRQAKTLMNKSIKAAQAQAAMAAGKPEAAKGKFSVSPQLAMGYCGLPLQIGAQAAIGHTALLEYQALSGPRCALRDHLAQYLEQPALFEPILEIGEDLFKQIAERLVKIVNHRILLEDLQRREQLGSVEFHRFALASVRTWQFRSLPEIVEAVVMFGDLLPDWRDLGEIHPGTMDLLHAVERASCNYLDRLCFTPGHELMALGKAWFRSIMRGLRPFLHMFVPVAASPSAGPMMKPPSKQSDTRREPDRELEDIAPLKEPPAPSLLDPADPLAQKVLEKLSGSPAKTPETKQEKGAAPKSDPFGEMVQNLAKASGQARRIEDTRSDILQETLRRMGLERGPIEGSLTDGHEVRMDFGDGREAAGEIHDRPIDVDYSPGAYHELKQEAEPVTRALRKMLYPNFRQILEERRFNTSGALDAARLPEAMFSDAVFKRYKSKTRKDSRGRPVLLIVCDSSGSMNASKVRMLKIVSFAFLTAATKTGIRLLAGLYNQGFVKPGLHGNLVRWLHHPRKTPAITRTEAARVVANMSDNIGSGGQADALSISFMVDEAIEIARGAMVYMVLITDCGWCSSFGPGTTAKQEVHRAIDESYEKLPGKLNTTLVALNHEEGKTTGFEGQMDAVINIPGAHLDNPAQVADKIGRYVAGQIRERKIRIR